MPHLDIAGDAMEIREMVLRRTRRSGQPRVHTSDHEDGDDE
jgi:hypothetical protein